MTGKPFILNYTVKQNKFMRQRSPLRGMIISLFVIALSFWNFSRSEGSETVKTLQIITLLTAGAAIGVFIICFIMWLKKRS